MPNRKLLRRAALSSLFLCAFLSLAWSTAQADNAAENGSPAAAPEPGASAERSGEEAFLDLISAYQSGYLQVVAVSCYQLYAGAGLVEGAFRAGHIDGPTALDILGQNSLLHSVCYSSLQDIQSLTPAGDTVARGEMNKLGSRWKPRTACSLPSRTSSRPPATRTAKRWTTPALWWSRAWTSTWGRTLARRAGRCDKRNNHE
jgi:hypothetical protein